MTPKTMLAQLLILACAWMPGWSQSYQSSFSEVKFDRAKGPATFMGGVGVDAASGAASMEIPFGPGIGERGLKFRPTLSMRIAPQLAVSSYQDQVLMYTSENGIQYWSTQTVDSLYQQGYGSSSFSPGTFDLPLYLYSDDGAAAAYSLPGGGNGTMTGMPPPAMNKSAAEALVTRFGITGTVVNMPDLVSTPTQNQQPFIRVGSGGHLILGLSSSSDVQDTLYSLNSQALYRWPRRILVVGGDVAYEFAYVSHRYAPQVRPYVVNSYRNVLFSSHFLLRKIANRFGESITFAYDPDGIGYTATWNTPGAAAVSIKVAAVETLAAPPMPSLGHGPLNMGGLTKIRVTYQGTGGSAPSYALTTGFVGTGATVKLESGGQPGTAAADTALRGQRTTGGTNWGGSMTSLQPVSIVQENTQETINFLYAMGPSVTWGTQVMAATVLKAVTSSARNVSLGWSTYKYRTNYSPNTGSPIGPRRRPTWAYGVCEILDTDLTSGASRLTTHERVVPLSNWLTEPPAEDIDITDVWLDKAFYTAVTHPDGQTDVHRFVEPEGPAGDLGFLKHLEREVRSYASGADWRADLGTADPGGSGAYRWVAKDHFSVNGVGAPDVPYPCRTREWDRESQVLSSTESTGWDGAHFGWTQVHRTTAVNEWPTMAMEATAPASYVSPGSSLGIEEVTTKVLDSKVLEWLFGRVSSEGTNRLVDNTGSSPAGAAPFLARELDATYNTLKSVTQGSGSGSTVHTAFAAKGDSGRDAALVGSVVLTGAGLEGSGQVGVAGYGYDGYGFMNAIALNPGTGALGVGQTQDALGRPATQTDFEGRVSAFTWDAAGRLTGIAPPGEQATTLTYGVPSHPMITVTRGDRTEEFVYNGFGELVLDAEQLKSVQGFIDKTTAKGEGAWKLLSPCSTFARDAWKAGTGENLKNTFMGVSTPNQLAISIQKANGGLPRGNLAAPRGNNSSVFELSNRGISSMGSIYASSF